MRKADNKHDWPYAVFDQAGPCICTKCGLRKPDPYTAGVFQNSNATCPGTTNREEALREAIKDGVLTVRVSTLGIYTWQERLGGQAMSGCSESPPPETETVGSTEDPLERVLLEEGGVVKAWSKLHVVYISPTSEAATLTPREPDNVGIYVGPLPAP